MNSLREDDVRRRGRVQRRLRLLAVLFPVVLLAASVLGALNIGPGELWKLLTGAGETSEVVRAVFWDIRLPRVLLAALVGASLALAGAGVQGLFRNPLAEPGILGVSAGASLGALLALVSGTGAFFVLPAYAFIGAFAAVGIILLL